VGRTITLGWNNTTGHSTSDGSTFSDNEFFRPDGTILNSLVQNQINEQETKQRADQLNFFHEQGLRERGLL
jgi:hypothetical protein